MTDICAERNAALLDFLEGGAHETFHPEGHWPKFARWAAEEAGRRACKGTDGAFVAALEAACGAELDAEDWEGFENNVAERFPPALYGAVPADVRAAFEADLETALVGAHAAEFVGAYSPACRSVAADGAVPDDTWLVHFTTDPEAVADEGFRYGVRDMDLIAGTRRLHMAEKLAGGYNFAFVADSADARHAAARGLYDSGTGAVLFRGGGVRITHYGDREAQVVFWGRDLDPAGFVPLRRDGDGWTLPDGSHADDLAEAVALARAAEEAPSRAP